ncbi:rubredoxin-like domain-containing protein, partial [Treponema porcinum]|uniref:rubredoxin-like domain-containing protein n=1 Tax=Treponema porcinum TaxID=261392 RepID=UPI0038B35CE0
MEGTIMAQWKCKVCGHIYEGDSLPEGFVCPVCKQPASSFVKVEESASKYAGTKTEKNLE